MDNDLAWSLLAAAVMLVGLVGVVLPLLPGLLLIWAAALVYGVAVGFGVVGAVTMVLLTALVALSVGLGFVLPRREAEAAGASRLAQLGGAVGAVIGFFTIPLIGVVVGALVGVLVIELLAKRDLAEAWTATLGTARGFGRSALADLGIGAVMISLWSIWALTVLL